MKQDLSFQNEGAKASLDVVESNKSLKELPIITDCYNSLKINVENIDRLGATADADITRQKGDIDQYKSLIIEDFALPMAKIRVQEKGDKLIERLTSITPSAFSKLSEDAFIEAIDVRVNLIEDRMDTMVPLFYTEPQLLSLKAKIATYKAAIAERDTINGDASAARKLLDIESSRQKKLTADLLLAISSVRDKFSDEYDAISTVLSAKLSRNKNEVSISCIISNEKGEKLTNVLVYFFPDPEAELYDNLTKNKNLFTEEMMRSAFMCCPTTTKGMFMRHNVEPGNYTAVFKMHGYELLVGHYYINAKNLTRIREKLTALPAREAK